MARAKEQFWRNKELMRRNLRLQTKMKMLQSLVWSGLRYGVEIVPLTKVIMKKI